MGRTFTDTRASSTALVVALCAATLLGCGGADEGTGRKTSASVGSSCPLTNYTQECECEMNMLPGRQVCLESGWGDCECLTATQAAIQMQQAIEMEVQAQLFATDPPANRSDNRFEWERTVPIGGSCEAGHYEGDFEGIYNAPLAFNAPIPVASVPNTAGLVFDLAKEGDGEVFNVSGGQMKGTANGVFPFEADIEGSLDCSSLRFEALILNGKYNAFGLDYFFEGTLVADYDRLTHSMINGIWDVMEPANVGSGGSGTWTVTWIP